MLYIPIFSVNLKKIVYLNYVLKKNYICEFVGTKIFFINVRKRSLYISLCVRLLKLLYFNIILLLFEII